MGVLRQNLYALRKRAAASQGVGRGEYIGAGNRRTPQPPTVAQPTRPSGGLTSHDVTSTWSSRHRPDWLKSHGKGGGGGGGGEGIGRTAESSNLAPSYGTISDPSLNATSVVHPTLHNHQQQQLQQPHHHHRHSSLNHALPSSPSSSPSLSSSNFLSQFPSNSSNIINYGIDNAPNSQAESGSPWDPLFAPTVDYFNMNGTEGCDTNFTSSCWSIFSPDDNFSSSSDQPSTPVMSTQMTSGDMDVIEYKYWTILLIVFPLLTVFGNILVVLSVFKEKSLKTVTNYFICSLAVADIMVAVVVMPFAVYMEVMSNRWRLSDPLCDAWVASDVLACTASILNLTAISVDRFIAVTQPIKYAKHKNSKRVFIMLAVTWIVSVAIAAPIALGVNYSKDRKALDCRFFNSDFIIYSSMGSFYIPSIIMIFLYWKIYTVIRQRARKANKAKTMRDVDKRAIQGVIENPGVAGAADPGGGGGGGGGGDGPGNSQGGPSIGAGGVYGAAPEATVTTGLTTMDNGRVVIYNTTTRTLLPGHIKDDVSNVQSEDNTNSSDEEEEDDDTGSGSANNSGSTARDRMTHQAEMAELIANPVAEEIERQEAAERKAGWNGKGNIGLKAGGGGKGSEEEQAMLQFSNHGVATLQTPGGADGGANQCSGEAETPFTSMVCKGDTSADTKDSSQDKKSPENGRTSKKKDGSNGKRKGHKKGVTKFNFHMRTSRKRKEKSSSKREKKATKTLAIVLGVFLVCWVPFFTINIVDAICIRYDLRSKNSPACSLDPIYFSFFVWLGYINSFLNPVIYTIFNPEFRKAFRKLLMEPCR